MNELILHCDTATEGCVANDFFLILIIGWLSGCLCQPFGCCFWRKDQLPISKRVFCESIYISLILLNRYTMFTGGSNVGIAPLDFKGRHSSLQMKTIQVHSGIKS